MILSCIGYWSLIRERNILDCNYNIISISCVASAAQAQDWSTYQGNAAHTGYVPGSYNFTGAGVLWQTSATPGQARCGSG